MAEETGSTTSEPGSEEAGRFGKAKEFVGDQYAKASSAMRDSYNTVREKVEDVDFDEVVDQVRGFVRSHPGKALLISVGVGFLIGLMLRRDEGEE